MDLHEIWNNDTTAGYKSNGVKIIKKILLGEDRAKKLLKTAKKNPNSVDLSFYSELTNISNNCLLS
jgi:hypothetical protein